MTVMVVAHPITDFNGRVQIGDVALSFVGGYAKGDVPTSAQADWTSRGYTLNASPATDYGDKYVQVEDLQDSASAAGVALRAAFVTVADRPVSVLQMPNPDASAVGDGTTHPLSSRFSSLAAAQAVFPAATALTEEIDRHALQLAFDTYPVVEAPLKRYLYLDKTVYTNAAGDQYIPSLAIKHRVSVPAFALLASGNTRTAGAPIAGNPTAAQAPTYSKLHLGTIRVDGSNDSGMSGNKPAVYLCHCIDLTIDDLVTTNAQGAGYHHMGTNDGDFSERHRYGRIVAINCWSTFGVRVSLRTRKVFYGDVQAHNCSNSGVYIDHSEANVSSLTATGNGDHGAFINNVFGCNLRGFRTTENGKHGVYVVGLNESIGDDWVSLSNGTGGAGQGWADVYFDDNNTLGYGVTKNSSVRGMLVGKSAKFPAGVGNEDYGLYVMDGVTQDVDLDVRHIAAGGVAYSRLPASRGTLSVREAVPGTLLPQPA